MAHLEWNVATAIEVDEVQKVLNKISGDRDEGSVQRERPKLQEKFGISTGDRNGLQ